MSNAHPDLGASTPEVGRLKKIIGDIHEAIGEDRDSDDDSLPETVRRIVSELQEYSRIPRLKDGTTLPSCDYRVLTPCGEEGHVSFDTENGWLVWPPYQKVPAPGGRWPYLVEECEPFHASPQGARP